MRTFRLVPLVLVAVSACSDVKHPSEMLGTWVQDSTFGDGIIHRADTLRLGKDGIALHSGSITATELATDSVTPVTWSEGLKWAFRPSKGGPLLCLFVQEGQEPECHTLRIASESVLVVDGHSYRRLPDR